MDYAGVSLHIRAEAGVIRKTLKSDHYPVKMVVQDWPPQRGKDQPPHTLAGWQPATDTDRRSYVGFVTAATVGELPEAPCGHFAMTDHSFVGFCETISDGAYSIPFDTGALRRWQARQPSIHPGGTP